MGRALRHFRFTLRIFGKTCSLTKPYRDSPTKDQCNILSMNNNTKSQSDPFAKLASDEPIKPSLVFGLDVGISSCGWAVVNIPAAQIVAMGSRCFDAPEDPQKKTLFNAERRAKRGMRRVTYRRKGRMKLVRRLIRESGLLEDPSPEFFAGLEKDKQAPDPWVARAQGVTRSLEPEDAAAALIHLAKHRGFKSNAKRDTSDKEGGKVLQAASEWEKKLDERTYGQTLVDDHQDRKRNKSGDYYFMPRREWLEIEARKVISRQRELGATWATKEFEDDYVDAAFGQRPLQSSEDLVGDCPFEQGEKRAARFSYSFELFRLLEKLVHSCRLSTPTGERPLTSEEVQMAVEGFGQSPGLSFNQLRKGLNLPADEKFLAALTEDDLKRDVTKAASKAAPGSYALYRVIGKGVWERLVATPAVLDRIAEVITFNEDESDIRTKLDALKLESETVEELMDALAMGKFSKFKGTGHISAKAARKLIPELLNANTYDKACTAVGYDHAAAVGTDIAGIKNPVVQRSLNQAIKQVEVMVRKFGRPERIHVEMLRDVGKSADERGQMTRGLDRRRKEREASADEFKSNAGLEHCSRDQVQMYELMKEQTHRCPYCDKHLTPNMILNADVQVDHIYPRSRSHEDGFVNKVLTCVPCNQQKRNRTPWEWRGRSDPTWWQTFESRVNNFNLTKREKRKRLLNKSFGDRELDFIERNKVDSSYVARALLGKLQELYPESYSGGTITPGAERRVFARPGTMTPKLQRAWLGDRYKKDRDDDRHHAMDALTVAFLDEPLYQLVARIYQRWEEMGQQQHYTPDIDPPWESFAQDCLDAFNGNGGDGAWLVCRTERRRARGALHEETIRRRTVNPEGNAVYWQRKSIESLSKTDIANIPDPIVRDVVTAWSEAPKPKEGEKEPPRLRNGDEIRKIRVPTKIATSNQINAEDMGGRSEGRQGGFVSNAEMVRVDVYFVEQRKSDFKNDVTINPGYYLVPVYAHDAAAGRTPIKAIIGGKPESDWIEMSSEDFIFSLYKDTFVSFERRDGERIKGYYRSTNRNGGGIHVSPSNNREKQPKSGARTIVGGSFRKFHVDRFGKLHEVKREKWPGDSAK